MKEMKVILVELVEIVSVVRMSKDGLGIRFVRWFRLVCVVRYGCAVALVECEIEVLSGSFAPWMLEKMKNNPYIKISAFVPKGGVYTTCIISCIFYTLYSYTA